MILNLFLFVACYQLIAADKESTKCTTNAQVAKQATCELPDKELIFYIMGDWGGVGFPPFSTKQQRDTADRMGKAAEKDKPKFILSMGDNFYPKGSYNIEDQRFKYTFEDVYTAESLKIPFYHTAGNHDHMYNLSSQVEYTKKSDRWVYPDPDFFYTIGYQFDKDVEVRIIEIDTIVMCGTGGADGPDAEPTGADPGIQSYWFKWVEQKLAEFNATADYMFVYGHFPILSNGKCGPTKCMIQSMLPLAAKYSLTSYVSGHDHNLQHLVAVADDGTKVNCLLSGMAGGAAPETVILTKNLDVLKHNSKFFYPTTKISKDMGGWVTAKLNRTLATFDYYNSDGKWLYQFSNTPRATKS